MTDALTLVALLLALLILLATLRPAPNPPPMELYMTPEHPTPQTATDLTLARMAEVMCNHFRNRGECTSADLYAAGFTSAEIIAYGGDAQALAIRQGFATAPDPATAAA